MKRIKVVCGICKTTKYYSIQRVVHKVSSIFSCENCRHFYQKLSKSTLSLDCISPEKGSCFSNCSFMKSRCKACWAMRILDSCPHPQLFYTRVTEELSEECRKLLKGRPLILDEINEDDRGRLSVEIYQNDEWVPSPSPENDISQLHINDDEDGDVYVPDEGAEDASLENQQEVMSSDDPILQSCLSVADLALETEEDIVDLEEEEATVDDPEAVESEGTSVKDSDDSLSSQGFQMIERGKRQRKKVEYFTKPVVSARKNKGSLYGPDGKLFKSGLDICDCLQDSCVGCHFPCPKCRSPKCGNECRVNRKWYYEKVEVEGTKLSWAFKH